MFLYVLANMGLRTSIQKICGSAPLRTLEDMANPLLQDLVEEEEKPQPRLKKKKEGKHDKQKRS